MKRIYELLYFQFYKLSLKISKGEYPKERAAILFSIFQILNLIELGTVISIVRSQIFLINWPDWVLFFIGLSIVMANIYYISNKDFAFKIEEYNLTMVRLGVFAISTYIIITILAFACLILYLDKNPLVAG